jgi:tetratricopeptide (TPR) repeat protein
VTQEFHISVTPVGDRYLVRTEQVPPGVPLAEEQMSWPVEEWLELARQLMNDPLTGLLQGYGTNRIGGFELPFGQQTGESSGNNSAHSTATLVELGQKLYSALFQATLRDSWMTAQGIAQHKGELLRLRLGLKGTQLPRLPWEVLYASDRSANPRGDGGLRPSPRPIAAGTDVLFSRYQPGTRVFNANSLPIEPNQPLRILMAIATPPDQEWLELKREAHHLQEELLKPGNIAIDSQHGKLPDIHLTILEQPGREQLTQALEQGHYHVLHYAGHSNLGAAGGNLYLVNNRTGLTEILSGDDLAGLLVNNGIWMAVFNSCRGAHTAAADPHINEGERNLAETLVNRGIPAVLAMAERIPDDVALNLTRLFYRNLKLGYPIDLSLSRARQGLITSYGSHQLYWALPMLYMHEYFDGYLSAEGDRTLNNSLNNASERLVVLPAPTNTHITLSGEDTPLSHDKGLDEQPLETEDDLAIISKAVLADDDDLDFVSDFESYTAINPEEADDEIEEEVDSEDDLSYEEDAAVVADLIQRLSERQGLDEPMVMTTTDMLLSEPPDAKTESYEDPIYPLPYRQSAWGESSNGAVPTRGPVTSPTASSVYEPSELQTPSFDLKDADLEDVATSIEPVYPPDRSRRSSSTTRHRLLLPVVGVLGTLAIALVLISQSSFLALFRPSRPVDLLPSPSPSTATNTPTPSPTTYEELSKLDNAALVLMATNSFSQMPLTDDLLLKGEQAVAELLNREALQEAKAALDAVPAERLDNPDISFLRGRLAWQQTKKGNSDYGKDDVRRFWETSVRGKPDTVSYYNALGFALYREGKFEDAIETWCNGLKVQQTQTDFSAAASGSQGNCPVPTRPLTNVADATAKANILDASAGIALALKKGVETNSFDRVEERMAQSIALYKTVISSEPVEFQPDSLSQNWLWTEEAILEWRSLASR